jgi:prolipoprotein diacylglyceryltransferase
MPTHFIFELAAYVIAFRLLLFRNLNHDTLPLKQRSFVLIGGLLGAIIGAKSLLILQYFNIFIEEPHRILNLFFGSGKTIVGSLLGGLIGVEITKKILRINSSTGA